MAERGNDGRKVYAKFAQSYAKGGLGILRGEDLDAAGFFEGFVAGDGEHDGETEEAEGDAENCEDAEDDDPERRGLVAEIDEGGDDGDGE